MKTNLQTLSAIIFSISILIFSISASAQSPERWEEIGPVDFTAITNQSPTTLVMPTTDGFLYVSTDYGSTWKHRYIDDTLCLEDVRFVDSLHGMLISASGTVLFTSDGGVMWSRSKIQGNLTRSAYLSLDTAIVCDETGKIWRTTDRGNTWNSQQLFAHPLYASFFPSSQIGFVCGDSGEFAKTSDAGATWITQDIGAGDSIYLHCIDFYNKDTGIVGGFANGEFGHTFVTTDGGNTWLNRPLPSAWTVTLNAIKLTTSSSLIAAGSENAAYSSTDLGESWNSAPIDGGELNNGVWYNPQHGALIIGSLGCVESSTNTGLDWEDANFCYGATQEYIINFHDTLIGVDIGNEGTTCIRSTDNGSSWGTYSLLNEFPWAGILFSSSSNGLALSGSDLTGVLQTTNGGLTWANAGKTDTFGFQYYNAYASSDNAAYLMYGDLGGIYSSDYGTMWRRVVGTPNDTISPFPNSKPSEHFFLAMSALGELHAYMIIKYYDTVIGNNQDYNSYNRIYQTTNGGQSWEEMKNSPAVPLCFDVYFHDPAHGFLCCDSGTIFRTSDSGQNWIRDSVCGYANNITSIGFFNDTLGFCGSHNAQIFRTTDGGISWENDSLRIPYDGTSKNTNEYFDEILFPDSNTVIATTRNGFYRRKLTSSPQARVTTSSSPASIPLSIYPNPTTSILHVISSSSHIVITDLLGRTWLHSVDGTHDLDVSGLPQGVYSISDGTSRAQFVKE